jgi:hypothetical protein
MLVARLTEQGGLAGRALLGMYRQTGHSYEYDDSDPPENKQDIMKNHTIKDR